MQSVTRRSFLAFAGSAVALTGLGAGAKLWVGDREAVRPPGGSDENAFAGACLKCDRCRSVCPEGAISLSSLEDGLVSARLPKMDYHKGYCDFCNRCVDVCPTGALRAIDPSYEKLGVAIVQQDRCVAWRTSGGCVKCIEACPYEAISLSSDHPVVDAAACNGCGICEYVCPALVLTSFSGGTRRGIVVVSQGEYERIGDTVVAGEEA